VRWNFSCVSHGIEMRFVPPRTFLCGVLSEKIHQRRSRKVRRKRAFVLFSVDDAGVRAVEAWGHCNHLEVQGLLTEINNYSANRLADMSAFGFEEEEADDE